MNSRIGLLLGGFAVFAWKQPRYTVGIENKVAPPGGLNPLAKPTRYQPAPGHAPSGKRRRQWR